MHVTGFNDSAELAKAFAGADRLVLISMSFVGEKLTGDDPITVSDMFVHVDNYQTGERHSKDA